MCLLKSYSETIIFYPLYSLWLQWHERNIRNIFYIICMLHFQEMFQNSHPVKGIGLFPHTLHICGPGHPKANPKWCTQLPLSHFSVNNPKNVTGAFPSSLQNAEAQDFAKMGFLSKDEDLMLPLFICLFYLK